ncbi:MOSC domain-containing protein [Limibaculum sp. M0105]|uniref:MOSC domain-containing protein n=1 Tax=Thermohalobaculum xanthum TaxID=2753746 RepID=A0A8J7SA68_9RHOB|nr:MOSC N-terminal beta barrel domain-containing protein [Thermohalobaculum xanthum]MBK0398147.1 MOSC domain-containing protein [Thermohalobaculum xanthum]
MSLGLASIWRHPVKSLGTEQLASVTLEAGRALPFDRAWAVAHGASAWDASAPAWVPCGNFLRVTHAPALAAVSARLDADAGTLTLTHPARDPITVAPADQVDEARLTEWLLPLTDGARPGPYRIATAPGAAMTDMAEPFVSILSMASLRALGQHAGVAPDPRRFRGNFWIDGADAWDEEDWVGRTLAIGPVRLRIVEPIGRCRAIDADPVTGRRGAPVFETLRETRGHTRFGLYAEVVAGGEIAQNAEVTLA